MPLYLINVQYVRDELPDCCSAISLFRDIPDVTDVTVGATRYFLCGDSVMYHIMIL